jgi:hypothetical protein
MQGEKQAGTVSPWPPFRYSCPLFFMTLVDITGMPPGQFRSSLQIFLFLPHLQATRASLDSGFFP